MQNGPEPCGNSDCSKARADGAYLPGTGGSGGMPCLCCCCCCCSCCCCIIVAYCETGSVRTGREGMIRPVPSCAPRAEGTPLGAAPVCAPYIVTPLLPRAELSAEPGEIMVGAAAAWGTFGFGIGNPPG